jgi:osmotically-inducible protein OsmY
MKTIVVLLALSMAAAVAQTPQKKAAPAPGGGGSKSTASAPAAAAASDAQIQAAIQARFSKSKISRNNFQVSVRGGVATLTGTTDIVQHKGTATRLAKSGGARGVSNQIQITDAARKKASEQLQGTRRAVVKRPEN